MKKDLDIISIHVTWYHYLVITIFNYKLISIKRKVK